MRLGRPSLLATLTLLTALGVAPRAQAQTPQPAASSEAKVAAEALFEDGRKLMAAGKASDACPKFADSQRLDPSPATLLNLASCYEKTNRPATAWATYREGASAAQSAGKPELVAAAQRHADALYPTLPRLSVTVQTPVDGLVVDVDGIAVGRAAWGVAVPVDPGDHTVNASAPHYKPWSQKVTAGKETPVLAVAIPSLEALPPDAAPPPPAVAAAPAPAPAPAPARPEDTTPPGHGQRIAGIVIGATGVVLIGVGAGLGLAAKSQANSSLADCPNSPNLCTQAGVSQRNSAMTEGNVASVLWGVGAAAVLGGVVVYLTAPKASSSRSVTATLVPTLGGAMLRGTW